jgi:hypothetical protein
MNTNAFLRSIGIGDLACKSILIDSWNKVIRIQGDWISRPNTEDIDDGWIVFEGVESCSFDPSGPLPNDMFESIGSEPLDEQQSLNRFSIVVWSIAGANAHNIASYPVTITIIGKSVHLEDPKRPGIRIFE